MPKYDFNKVALWHGCSPVNLPHIFRIPFPMNTSGRFLLFFQNKKRKCDLQSNFKIQEDEPHQ